MAFEFPFWELMNVVTHTFGALVRMPSASTYEGHGDGLVDMPREMRGSLLEDLADYCVAVSEAV